MAPNWLFDLEVDEVSFVPKGANEGAHIAIWKMDSGNNDTESADENVDKGQPAGSSVHVDVPTDSKKDNKRRRMMRDDDAAGDEMEEDKDVGKIDTSLLPEDVQEYIKTLETANADLQAEVDKNANPGKTKEGVGSDSSAVLKGLTPEAQVIIAKMQADHADAIAKAERAEASAAFERNVRITKEFVGKAETDYRGLPLDPQEMGPVLKSLNDTDPTTYEKIDAILKAAASMVKRSRVFDVIGADSAPGASGTSVAKIEARAEEIRKAKPDLTREQAIDQAYTENPEAYAAYMAGEG